MLLCVALLVASALPSEGASRWSDTLTEEEVTRDMWWVVDDYAEKCLESANATWAWMMRPTRATYKRMMDTDENLAKVKRHQAGRFQEYVDRESLEDEELYYKVKLVSFPGISLLQTLDYREVLEFRVHSQNITEKKRIPCFNESNSCHWNWKESQQILAHSYDPHKMHHVWIKWHHLLEHQAEAFPRILYLLQEAAEQNGADTISEYWKILSGSSFNASSFWVGELSTQYDLLRKLVLSRLQLHYGKSFVGTDGLLPLHLLGSFVGDNWQYIAELVAPHTDGKESTYVTLQKSLKRKKWDGKHLYQIADGVATKLGLTSLSKFSFWENAYFNGSCPAVLVHWCHEGHMHVQTCNESGIMEYIDAHRAVMQTMLQHLSSGHKNKLLQKLNRERVIDEAVAGLGELISLAPQQLVRLGLLQEENEHVVALRLLVALRVFPKLAHAVAADAWREQGNNGTWDTFRSNIKGVRPPRDVESSWEFVIDSKIASNEPYFGTFAGIILQFQLFEKFLGGLKNSSANPVDIIKGNGMLRKLMAESLNGPWPEILKRVLNISSLDPRPMLAYFEPLKHLFKADLINLKSMANIMNMQPPDLKYDTSKETITEEATAATTTAAHNVSLVKEDEISTDNSDEVVSSADSHAILIGSVSLICIAVLLGVGLISWNYFKKRKNPRNRRHS